MKAFISLFLTPIQQRMLNWHEYIVKCQHCRTEKASDGMFYRRTDQRVWGPISGRCDPSPPPRPTSPLCLTNPTTNMLLLSAFQDTVAAMSLIQNKAHDTLIKKKTVFTGSTIFTCSAFAFRSTFVSSAGWFGCLSAEFQCTRWSRSFCRIKNNYFPVHIMYAELFTIIIPRRQRMALHEWTRIIRGLV